MTYCVNLVASPIQSPLLKPIHYFFALTWPGVNVWHVAMVIGTASLAIALSVSQLDTGGAKRASRVEGVVLI